MFALVILLGAAVSALFANDGTALILTPIVLAMLTALGFSPATTLAFILATGFIADSSSLPLIISNLVNIVTADFFDIGFGEYASVMVPVDLAAIAASLGMLSLLFRKDLPHVYELNRLEAPQAAIRDPQVFRMGFGVLGVLLVGYFAAEPLGLPVSLIAVVGAVLLYFVAARGSVISTKKSWRVRRGRSWCSLWACTSWSTD